MDAVQGKGKRALRDKDGYIVEFLDSVTGHAPGIPDPGGNVVVGTDPGSGERALAITLLLWEALRQAGLPVLPMVRVDECRIRVPAAELIPLEVIVRHRATGSFIRRYGKFVPEGASLSGLIEFTVKDDAQGDPLILEEAVAMLGLASREELAEMRRLATKAGAVLQAVFAGTGIELWDFKLEFARYHQQLVVRDELSPRTMRFRNSNGDRVPDAVVLDTLRHRSSAQQLTVATH